MNGKNDKPRIVIVLTETCPVDRLWRAANEAPEAGAAELLALFIDDERWQRIASLPFTREFAMTGGSAEFTAARARRLFAETTARIRQEVDRLARESGRVVAFETLPGSDSERTSRLLGPGRHLLIAGRDIEKLPIYAQLASLEVEIRFVEAEPPGKLTEQR
jgi:hypothetical protein